MLSLFTRSILFFFVVSIFMISQTIHPTSGQGTTSTCVDTNITGISASGSSQNFPPNNVVDKNFNTLWSTYGKGSWVQLDLGSSKNICSVNIAWYKGDTRQSNFVISTSTDGSSYKNVLSTKSSGNTLSFDKYVIPNTLARYVKIIVNGNTQNDYASITEVKLQTTTSNQPGQTQCSTATIGSVKASASATGYPSSYVIDNNLKTRWSNDGKGSWIQLDLGSSKNICSVNIAWFKGNERQSNFIISTSKDGTTFSKVLEKKSSGTTQNLEEYVLPNPNARYIKITVNGNTQNDYASITEVKLQTTTSNQPGQTQCSTATIGSVKASASATGYPSSYVIDNNLKTRWSNDGKGSWIQLDLGSSKNICSVNIAWFKGNERQSNFIISTSKDGTTFSKVLEKKSSGTTQNLEEYVLPNPNARYIKITVNGNTQNDYASIIETKIIIQNTVTTPGTGDNSGAGDGVKMIYPTLTGGEKWFFNPTNPNDGQFDRNGAEITKNSDGSWRLKPGTTRMLAFTKSSGLPSDEVRSSLPTYDYSRLAQTGYFYKPTDWKNIEITIYVKVLSASGGGDEISLVSRSVRHSSNVQEGCGGSSYHNNIDFTNGKFKFKKEMWHVNYDIKPYSGISIGSTMSKWIGFKGVVYNLPDGSVKLESYIDKDNNNNWQKATEFIDKGNWGDDMSHCNARTDGAAITWGSPMVIFKSNGVTYDFKNFSVRQIVPPA